ncbi:MAG: PSD1 and planctomycete cytochrome C domain-containing protein [Planctomycetota bacterium]|nr:PSD1 and planctomycete cytochrome C domain-containing protein [Planctomycetota bacterium]MDA1248449.1 PSD1 and planctomycete cytochrome C domain-containing protein [Planctomycetota bacterium]
MRISVSLPAVFYFVLLSAGRFVCAAEPVDFSRDIRPILSDRCFHCHGPDASKREGELRLDQAPKTDRLIVVNGQPEKSLLWERIISADPEMRMPPVESGKPLKPEEIALIRKWIEQSGNWSDHWAFLIPIRTLPATHEDRRNIVDRLLEERFKAEGVQPAPEADRVTLIRRVSFDLTGLPPTPEEVDTFVNDDSPEAWEKVVDRLLASEAYGERMAVYWLDLVRYADTVGYHGDQDHNSSPYRDWVIDAFIDNMPFDQFTRTQLAGDLLPEAGTDELIATGYNRLLQTSHEGGVQAKEYLAMYAADRVRNLSAVWLGGTLGCAQCHDHKFDPYTTRDFYSMAAFFADIDEVDHLTRGSNSLPTRRMPEIKVHTKRERARLAELTGIIEKTTKELASDDSASDLSPESKTELEQKLASAKAEHAAITKAARLAMITKSVKPREMRVLPRGDWLNDSGEVVQPSIPHFLGTIDRPERATRLDLANWLTNHKGGIGLLTARVFANRFWYLMFGRGLSRSLDDFGGQGEPPTHPRLLDRLAFEFVDSGWNVKSQMKLLAMSDAYRRSSVYPATPSPALRAPSPPEGGEGTKSGVDLKTRAEKLFAVQSRSRLPAEMVRDNALAVSGLLVQQIGGASVKPYQPAGYYRHLNFPTRTYSHHTDVRQWRRGLYVHWQRQFLHPMMKAFDGPRREECTAQRAKSNTPLAALTLLNDPTFVEAARAFATRILDAGGSSDDERLDVAFRLALSRKPDEFESQILTRLLAESRKGFSASKESAQQLVSTGQAPVDNTHSAAELAAWTTVARAILNLNETNTRN